MVSAPVVCKKCDERAVNALGEKPYKNSELLVDDEDNPVFIDGIKCWRRHRFGGFVTMRDYYDCQDIMDFYEKQLIGK